MRKRNNLFVTFEGIEGCGKSYQSKKLYHSLKKLNLPGVSKSISFKYAFVLGRILEFFYNVFHVKKEPLMTRFLATQLAKSHYFNIEQSKKDFDYKPIVSNEEGLKHLINDYYSRQED